MKRLISICTLLLLILASCDAPVSQLDNKTKHSPDDVSTQLSYNPSSALADTNRQAVWQQFKSQNGPKWKMTWSEKTGTPLTVFSGTTKPIPGSPEQAARTFLGRNLSLFSMRSDLSGLKLLEVGISSRGNRHVRFQQTHKGVPVYEATYQVHIRPGGRVDMANGHYYPDIEVSTNPSISAASAVQTAENDLDGRTLKEDPETELMIVRHPETEAFALAWKVLISVTGSYWQYFVDARSGQIIDKLDLVATITGDGDIIEDHPNLTPNPVNQNLYRLDGSGYLRGNYANVHNDDANRAFSSTNSFQYNTSSTHFDEVNVYHHIDIYRASYLDDLGFNSDIGSDQDLEAWVHDQERPTWAYYNPGGEEVRFGDVNDYAKEDKVIYHEFIHAVADVENGGHYLDPNDDEEGAIGEGISDFHSGSFTGRSMIGEYSFAGPPRDMDNPDFADYSELPRDQQTGEVNVSEHDGGEFFSAILWDLRNDGGISTQEAEEIAFEAISRLSGSPTFIEYRDAMMAVDSDVNGGTYSDLIQNTFANRGVGTFVPPSVSISGPSNMFEGTSDTFTANVSGGQSPYQYQWYYKHESDPNWTLASGETSSTYTHTAGPPNGEYVKVSVTDSRSANNEAQHYFTITGACC